MPCVLYCVIICEFSTSHCLLYESSQTKSSSLNCRLGCCECSSSALEGRSLYGQQYDSVLCCATIEQPVTVSLSALCKWAMAVRFTVCWNTTHFWLWSHICALLIGDAHRQGFGNPKHCYDVASPVQLLFLEYFCPLVHISLRKSNVLLLFSKF